MSRLHRRRATWVLAAAAMVAAGSCGGGADRPASLPAAETTLTTFPATSTSSSSTMLAAATTTEAVRVIEVAYAGGQVAGGAQRATVRLGDKVRLRVTSDVDDVVHVHTYDIKAAVTPAQPAQLELVASIPGRHEVELEKKRRQLLVLEVK